MPKPTTPNPIISTIGGPPEKPLSKPPHPPKKVLRRSIAITKE
jgi:hypothetical protein